MATKKTSEAKSAEIPTIGRRVYPDGSYEDFQYYPRVIVVTEKRER